MAFQYHNAYSHTFVDLTGGLTESELYELLSIEPIGRIQINGKPEIISDDTAVLLNRFFEERPEVILRFYGFYRETLDLAVLRNIPKLQKLSIDYSENVINTEWIASLKNLDVLNFDVSDAKEFPFLIDLPASLTALSLGSKSPKTDLSNLSRFPDLKVLDLNGCKGHIETIASLLNLEELHLRGITPPGFDFIATLPKLESLNIFWSNLKDFTPLKNNKSLRYLNIGRITGLDNVSFVSELSNLEWLELVWMPNIVALPDMKYLHKLWYIKLDTMKGLADFSALESAPALRIFEDVAVPSSIQPENFLPVLRNPSLEACRVFFSSSKKNKQIAELTEAHGKASKYEIHTPFRGTPFL
ncbi:hypothetical protein AGMMS49983_14010 [Clostridia bacterium]|nr:hypothetical protein AGMMS49983_14010 [Clostridia bacterium]